MLQAECCYACRYREGTSFYCSSSSMIAILLQGGDGFLGPASTSVLLNQWFFFGYGFLKLQLAELGSVIV